MLLFLKVVTKGREIKKSRLNNSLTNWAFQFLNVLSLIKTFEEFVLVEMKVKKQKLTKYSLSFFAWKRAYTLWWFDCVNKAQNSSTHKRAKPGTSCCKFLCTLVDSSYYLYLPLFLLLLLSLILSTLLFPVVCTQDPEFFFFFLLKVVSYHQFAGQTRLTKFPPHVCDIGVLVSVQAPVIVSGS